METIQRILKSSILRVSIIVELFGFLWEHKLWWIMPVISIMLIIALVLVFGQSTGVAPFIYPFF